MEAGQLSPSIRKRPMQTTLQLPEIPRNAALPEPLRHLVNGISPGVPMPLWVKHEQCRGAGCPGCNGLGRIVDRNGTSHFTAQPITVRREQPTADVIQDHIRVTVSVEKSDGITPGSVDAELSRTYLDFDYSQAGYDPTDGEYEPIKVYFCQGDYEIWAKATPERLAGSVWRIWLVVEEVTCGE